ncbi:S1 RNA-binding domain-containing protein 1 [Acipenser ruthenus]|uniref:S1 RNA-binding domain-containing protein 1 n=1 Tax=Acipenser ruthenus TaxID=7906 RepID=A0A444UGZ2_ACIRT|nr:S1 RNA-binding domain-containing protein 1 [Acipenser ruthenus]
MLYSSDFRSTECENEEEEEEWVPESKVMKPRKKPAKLKEPKAPTLPKPPKAPKQPKVPKTPKPKAPKKTAAEKPKVGRKTKVSALEKDAGVVGVPVKEEVLSERTVVDPWVCENLVNLFKEENTIPFIVRYRKELSNHMDVDAVRDVQLAVEELRNVAKKVHAVIQTLKKEGTLTISLEKALLNCRSADELDHVRNLAGVADNLRNPAMFESMRQAENQFCDAQNKVCKRKALTPRTSSSFQHSKPKQNGQRGQHAPWMIHGTPGNSNADTDEDLLKGCEQDYITIHSTMSKTALKEQKDEKGAKPKDIDKFQLYADFTANVKNVHHHQILAINRGENLKILTVEVNIPDRVKNEFIRWCLNVSRNVKIRTSYAVHSRNVKIRTSYAVHSRNVKIRTSYAVHSRNVKIRTSYTVHSRNVKIRTSYTVHSRNVKIRTSYTSITSEAGASIYSVSPEAVKEMPDLDPNLRSAGSLLAMCFLAIAESLAGAVGVFTAQSVSKLRFFVKDRTAQCSQQSAVEAGGQASRAGVPSVTGAGGAAGKPPSKKSKSKTTGSAAQQLNPLDQTCIHPESYDNHEMGFQVSQSSSADPTLEIAIRWAPSSRFLLLIGGSLQDIGKLEMQSKVNAAIQKEGMGEVSQKLNTVLPTLQIITDGLTQPQGFDIRQGTVLTGRVVNAALFGAFVDIGVGQSGLIHKKYITEAKLPQDERRRILALGPGEKVEVRVLSVDVARGRIGLDLIRVLR